MLMKSVHDTNRKEDGTVNWMPALFSALYIYRLLTHSAIGTSPAMLVYGEELQLPIYYNNSLPPSNQIQYKEQIANRLRALRSFVSSLRTSQFKYSVDKEGWKVLIHPIKYQIDEKVLLCVSKFDKTRHSASPFEPHFSGPYQITQVLSKGAYRLKTIQVNGGAVKFFRKPTNWSRLRRYFEDEREVTE